VWNRIAEPFRGSGTSPRRVYLSRTAHNTERRLIGHRSASRSSSAKHDEALDRVFRQAGFDVVYPETLTLDKQLATVAAADVLASPSGSALHLSAFAPRSAQVLEVGDLRSPDRPMMMQLLIDAACGHQHCFVRGNTEPYEVAAQLKQALA
jgi:capsular polysaccharide biosynthesis protein